MQTRIFALVVLAGLLPTPVSVPADVTVPNLFGDHMVLQRDLPVPVWGTARAGESVTVTLGDQTVSAMTDDKGRWKVTLGPLSAGGPLEMTIAGENTITIRDVLVGEVWVGSGQSNMGWPVSRAKDGEQEAEARFPKIRLLHVDRIVADEPQHEVGGHWKLCSPQTVGNFSAVAYFFGRELHRHLKVPVGIINSSRGGTPAEAWTAKTALEGNPLYQPIFDRWEQTINDYVAKERAASTTKTDGGPAGNGNNQASKRPSSQTATQYSDDPRESPHRPGALYNGMIHPLMPYAIRGVIWYQGESNAPRAYQYRELMPTLIRTWREQWGQGDFPFLMVQLANFQSRQKEPYTSDWAELREAQSRTLALPRTGMAVAIDIGDPKDIHPANKQDVARRLALAARAIAYGEKIPYSGPLYDSMKAEGGGIRLRFSHTNGGLEAKGGELKGFGIAGRDRKFVDAKAVVDGDTVVVSSEQVAEPVAVRYAWADAPLCNLYNGAGLPASPFRTDDWPGITDNER
ncbi:MAG TPA: sialate O-acetylesterase [Phycisphaerae bacterium]|nr:sialate O-acetylesterase [Phycisphaerae bacterium]